MPLPFGVGRLFVRVSEKFEASQGFRGCYAALNETIQQYLRYHFYNSIWLIYFGVFMVA
jgi:hypothetical protein